MEWTSSRGEYAFRGIEPGDYFVDIMRFSAPSESMPFIGVYYPGVEDESVAAQVRVNASNATELLPVRLHRAATTTVLVNVSFQDGSRPARSNLLFQNTLFPAEAVIGDVAPQVSNGRGSFTLPVGFEYIAQAKVDCDADAVIQVRESRPAQRVSILREKPVRELTFVIPGSACKLWEPR